jgi:glycerophosphoryl diester phosphodiesterase
MTPTVVPCSRDATDCLLPTPIAVPVAFRPLPPRTLDRVKRGPRADQHPFFDNGGLPLAFAHRGGALTGDNLGLENTMLAFESAVRLGYRYVETDVHATADGRLIAFHDPTLDRTTDRLGRITDLTYDQVSRALIGGREALPLLHEVLTSWPELRLNVDAKSAGAIDPLVRVVTEHRAWHRVCLASFSPVRLRRIRSALGPRVATSYSALGVAGLRLLPTALARRVVAGEGHAAQVPVRRGPLDVVTPAFVARAHELGKHVHVWTVDEPAEMRRLLDLGVDGIMTDRIDLLRDVLVARGSWRTRG